MNNRLVGGRSSEKYSHPIDMMMMMMIIIIIIMVTISITVFWVLIPVDS
jgi:hypothetical protein